MFPFLPGANKNEGKFSWFWSLSQEQWRYPNGANIGYLIITFKLFNTKHWPVSRGVKNELKGDEGNFDYVWKFHF